MKRLLLIFLCISLNSYAQHTADNWFFGVLAGIHFTSSCPVAQSGMINSNEGTACVSDSLGNLLFYTDGNTVWNRNHVVMPSGTGLMGGTSSTQSALIIPSAESPSNYYIFTTPEAGDTAGFRYSTVNMSLDSGRGDIDQKNVFILDSVTEKLTAMRDEFGQYHIAIHRWGDDSYYVYTLTPFGLSLPSINHTGIFHTNAQIQNTYGQMKFSPCGDKIVAAVGYLDTVDVSDFDPNTNTISNTFSIPVGAHVYGVEFSPDETKLYISNYSSITVKQYDLTLSTTSAIIASATGLTITPDIYGLQLGPDEKIYVSKSFNSFLDRIDSPNVTGPGCAYTDNALNLDPGFSGITSSLGLPNFPSTDIVQPVCIGTYVDNITDAGSLVYPVPFSDYLHIIGVAGTKVRISDCQDRTILEGELTNGAINTTQFPAGFYLLQLKTKNEIRIQKILKTD